jgi:hypothetical protein
MRVHGCWSSCRRKESFQHELMPEMRGEEKPPDNEEEKDEEEE